MKEKDMKVEEQRAEITNLRKKNFEFRSKYQELQDQMKAIKHHRDEKDKKKEQASENHKKNDEMQAQILAIHMQQHEARQREKEIMMQVIMNSMNNDNAEAEE